MKELLAQIARVWGRLIAIGVGKRSTPTAGLTAETAIPVSGVREEYQWMDRHYRGYRVVMQGLTNIGGRPMDRFELEAKDGTRVQLFFDISSFFGDGNQPDTPCPFCGQPLRTPRAKQCRHCHRSWH